MNKITGGFHEKSRTRPADKQVKARRTIMDKYIGTKIIEAEPATCPKEVNGHPVGEMGYKVKYPDGYVSWSPKDVFEKAYLKIIPNPRLKTDIFIS